MICNYENEREYETVKIWVIAAYIDHTLIKLLLFKVLYSCINLFTSHKKIILASFPDHIITRKICGWIFLQICLH